MSIGWIIAIGATVIYIVGGAFIWAVSKMGDDTHRDPKQEYAPPSPILDPKQKFDIIELEKLWRSR